jgi:DUF1680 family protein
VDVPENSKVFSLAIPAKTQFSPKLIKIENSDVMALQAKAKVIGNSEWKNQLYKEVTQKEAAEVPVQLIPYYAWGNRGHAEMSVWLPVTM